MQQLLVPSHILSMQAAGRRFDSFDAATLFVDISGFTPLTAALMSRGSAGAEELSEILGSIFAPMVASVYANAGFVTVFAGDAFTAVFTGAETAAMARARTVAHACRAVIDRNHLQRTESGTFALEAGVGIGYGAVQAGIIGSDESGLSYYYRGASIEAAIIAEAESKAGTVGESVGTGTSTGKTSLPDDSPVDEVSLQSRFLPLADIPWRRAGEFRRVVSLFLSVDAGQTYDEIDATVTRVLESSRAYGGYFNMLDFGDKGCVALILFGAPRSSGKEAERAAGCARSIAELLGPRARMGLATGTVFAGYMGGDDRGTYTALGETVNLSARLAMKRSEAGISVHEPLARSLKDVFVFGQPRALRVKGVSIEVTVRDLDTSHQDVVHGERPAIAGRQRERRELETWLNHRTVAEGLRILTLVGDAGVGKSLLIEYSLDVLSGGQTAVLRLITEPILAKSMNLFFELVPEVCRLLGEPRPTADTVADCQDRLVAHAYTLDHDLGRELESYVDALPALMGYPGGDTYREREARARYEMLSGAAIQLLRVILHERPVVLVTEDMHTSDRDSRDVLERILRAFVGSPLDLVLVRRPLDDTHAPNPSLPAAADHTVLELLPMRPDDLARLATAVLGGPVSSTLSEFLFRRVGGNPFYATELVRYLKQSGQLRSGSDGFAVRGDETDIPHSITAILVERLDQLDARVRDVAAIAAVIGLEFGQTEVAAADRSSDTDAALSGGVRAGLWQSNGDATFRFSQALVRDALLSMQLSSERRKIHGLVYEALQNTASSVSDRAPERAYHAEQAGRIPEALEHLWSAFNDARANFKNEAAESFLKRYLHLCKLPSDTLKVHVELGALYELTGDWDKGADSLVHALGLAVLNQETTIQIEVQTSLARIFSRQGRAREAVRIGEQAVAAAEAAGRQPELSAALTALGRALWTAGKLEEADSQLTRAAQIAESIVDPEKAGLALYYRGVVLRDRGDFAGALKLFKRSQARLEEHGDAQLITFPLYDIGVLSQYEGDLDSSQTAFEHVLEIYRQTGYRSGESAAVLNLGVLTDRRGNFEDAIGYFEQARHIAEEIGEQLAIAYTLFSIGATYYKMLDNRKALIYLKDSLKLMKQLGARGYYAYPLSYLAALYSRVRNADKVLTICMYHREAIEAVGNDPEHGFALMSLGRVLAKGKTVSVGRQGELQDLCTYYGVEADDPGSMFREAIRRSTEAGYVNTLISARYHYGRFLCATGRETEGLHEIAEALKLARGASWHSFVEQLQRSYGDQLDALAPAEKT